MTKTYYIHYTLDNIRGMTTHKGDINTLSRLVSQMIKDNYKMISAFDYDTSNTSEPNGLVLFDVKNKYWTHHYTYQKNLISHN